MYILCLYRVISFDLYINFVDSRVQDEKYKVANHNIPAVKSDTGAAGDANPVVTTDCEVRINSLSYYTIDQKINEREQNNIIHLHHDECQCKQQ